MLKYITYSNNDDDNNNNNILKVYWNFSGFESI